MKTTAVESRDAIPQGREPRPAADQRVGLIARAKSLGYDTDMLRYTEQPAR